MFMFIQKYYPENFGFLILGILELYIRKVCKIFIHKHTEMNILKIILLFKKNTKLPENSEISCSMWEIGYEKLII